MKNNYHDLIDMVERIHRLSLEILKTELNKAGIREINNVQSILLYKIGDKNLRISDLIDQGCYLGSNVSYNLRKLVENGYLLQEPHKHDKRCSEIRRTPKGIELCDFVDKIFDKHEKFLDKNGTNKSDIQTMRSSLISLDRNLRKIKDYD